MGRERYLLDLAFAGQGRVVDRKIPDLENLLAALAHAVRIHLLELAADHSGDDLIERDVGYCRGLADRPAITQHHDAIGNLCDLFHLVRDVAHADAGLPQAADHPKKLRNLLVGQGRCRLIEDKNACAPRQGFGDFDHLLLADRDVFHPVGGLDIDNSQLAKQRLGIEVQTAPIDGAKGVGRLTVEKDVLGDSELSNEVELLMDDGDARIHGLAGAAKPPPLSVDENIALIGGIGPDATEHFHQCRFAGAVLAHQRQNLAGAGLEGDVVECLDA